MFRELNGSDKFGLDLCIIKRKSDMYRYIDVYKVFSVELIKEGGSMKPIFQN